MNENENKVEKPNPERIKALKGLPQDLMERLTKEEVHAFLFDEVWPDSLQEKLKDYLVEEESVFQQSKFQNTLSGRSR